MRKKWVSETSLERAGKRQTVYNIIHRLHMTRVESLADEAARQNIDRGELKTIVTDLKLKGLIYTPKPGTVGCVDE